MLSINWAALCHQLAVCQWGKWTQSIVALGKYNYLAYKYGLPHNHHPNLHTS